MHPNRFSALQLDTLTGRAFKSGTFIRVTFLRVSKMEGAFFSDIFEGMMKAEPHLHRQTTLVDDGRGKRLSVSRSRQFGQITVMSGHRGLQALSRGSETRRASMRCT